MSEAAAESAMVEAALDKLIEHFDSVQIFCTRAEPSQGCTICIGRGRGNWFARYGQIVEFVEKCKEVPRISARHDAQEDSD